MTQMRDPATNPMAAPPSAAKLTSDQLAAPPKHLAGKLKKLRVAGFNGPRPWGGDKIAFEPVAELAPEARAAAAKAADVIDTARTYKRVWKAGIEKRKEDDIKTVKKLANLLQPMRPSKPLKPGSADAKAKQLEVWQKLEAGELKLSKQLWTAAIHVVLMTDNEVIAQNKFLLKQFHDEVGQMGGWDWPYMAKQFQAAGLVVREGESGHQILTKDGHPVYAVHWGDDRVEPKPGEEGVLRQKGSAGLKASEARRKEYVRDANDILTRRFQYREINYHHLANMLGLKVDAKADSVGPSGLPPGQRPRGDGRRIDGHTSTLNVNDAAVVNPENWQGRYEPVGEATPLTESRRTGTRVRPSTPLTPDSATDHNESSSLQVRNGSGAQQPRLSSAAAQLPPDGYEDKVIRGNKGERFSETNDNVAAIEYDLVLANKAGLSFVNQYSEESHEFKIAYARYKEGSTTEEKRSALQELDEYIYSARKNREVTIDEVPNKIVTKIRLNGASGLWDKSGLPTDRWLAWDAASRGIAQYITAQRLHTQHWVAGYLDEQDSHASKAKL